ncbi:MAG: Gfo/Idh/MocA family oxidoreductase [Clostridiales bacterium]|nr:Gfo/Idh/MocA family oxidoreductase [Clostridiales bacterium]
MELKAAVIGCGRISPMHLVSIKKTKNARLVAVCDIKEDRARAAAAANGCRYYTDYKKMLDDEDLDVVHICTPHYLHHDMAVYAAQRGIHVITEKPMAINYGDALDMVKKCRENGVTLSVMFQNRYNRAVQYIKQEIGSGNLGRVLSARIIVTWDRRDEYYLKSDWKGTWDKEGGGVVIDQAIHSIDIVRYIIGKEALSVEACIHNRRHKKFKIEDTAEGIIEFEDNILASFYTMNYFTFDMPIEITFHCEKGVCGINGDEGFISYKDGRYVSIKPLDEDKIDYGNGAKKYWGYCHFIEIKNAYEAIEDKRNVDVNGEDCLKTQQIINSIYESGKSGFKIYLKHDANI